MSQGERLSCNPLKGFFRDPGILFGQDSSSGPDPLHSRLTVRLEKSKSIVAPQWRTPTWVVLGLGFGGLLICIIIAATGTLWTLQSVRNSEAASRKRFLDRIELLDQILVMTVNPGFGGQSFLQSQLRKVSALRQMIDGNGGNITLAVDGGITLTNI